MLTRLALLSTKSCFSSSQIVGRNNGRLLSLSSAMRSIDIKTEEEKIAGAEYFKSLIDEHDDNSVQKSTSTTSAVGNNEQSRKENLVKKSKSFAKNFLERQIEYNKMMREKENAKEQHINEEGLVFADQKPRIESESKYQTSTEELKDSTETSNSSFEKTMVSTPRNWDEEIKKTNKRFDRIRPDYTKRIEKYKEKTPEQQLKHSKYAEYRYGKSEKTTKPIRERDTENYEERIKELATIDRKTTSLTASQNSSGLSLPPEDKLDRIEEEEKEALSEEEALELAIKRLRPAARPVVYNLAYFANSNRVLQTLIEMGVSVREWDQDTRIGSMVLKLDLERDLKPRLIFLHDLGIPPDVHPKIITKNPMFLRESIDNLNVRIEYLKSKKFTDEQIRTIITTAPKWLSTSVSDIDTRLGWLQREFGLTTNDVREIVFSKAKLAILPLKVISDVRFGLKEFLGFEDQNIRSMIKSCPKLFTKEYELIQNNFTFLNKVAKLSNHEIAFYPPILYAPLIVIKSRFAFLKHLDRVQFDPTKPNYVTLKSLAERDDKEFCRRTAKTSLDEYNKFLKTL